LAQDLWREFFSIGRNDLLPLHQSLPPAGMEMLPYSRCSSTTASTRSPSDSPTKASRGSERCEYHDMGESQKEAERLRLVVAAVLSSQHLRDASSGRHQSLNASTVSKTDCVLDAAMLPGLACNQSCDVGWACMPPLAADSERQESLPNSRALRWNNDLAVSLVSTVAENVAEQTTLMDRVWEPEGEDCPSKARKYPRKSEQLAIRGILEELRDALADELNSEFSEANLEEIQRIQDRLSVESSFCDADNLKQIERIQDRLAVESSLCAGQSAPARAMEESCQVHPKVDNRSQSSKWCWEQLTDSLAMTIQSTIDLKSEAASKQAAILRSIKQAAIVDELQAALVESAHVSLAHDNMEELEQCKKRLSLLLSMARDLDMKDAVTRAAEVERRRIHYGIQDLKGQIRVCCRVRELSNLETESGHTMALKAVNQADVEVSDGSRYAFDRVFAPGSQDEVFDECRDMIESAVEGRNVTLFTYGQTGAGKTYTMYGDSEQQGIAPRAISQVFHLIDAFPRHRSAKVTASVAELYNSDVFDLLEPIPRDAKQRRRVVLRDSSSGAVQADLLDIEVASADELTALLSTGLSRRSVGDNGVNDVSSRSHLIFTITITSATSETGEMSVGKVMLCDLGGAERLKKSSLAGMRQKESIELNKSLAALGNVFSAIARKDKLVPYRDHKLTRLMQDALGGTSKTLMVVNCSAAASNLSESLQSLKYAARVAQIERQEKHESQSRCPTSSARWIQ